MNWIRNLLRKKYQIFLYILSFLILINPYTLSLFDSNPPLSNHAYLLIYTIHIFNLLGVALFIFKREIFIQCIFAGIFLIIFDLALSPYVDNSSADKLSEFRRQNPEPYVNAEYYSPEFIDESLGQKNGWILDHEYGGVKPNNFVGQWINIHDNRRKTVNADGVFNNKLYLFGGSTVFNSEVPDSLTIASQLASFGANKASFEVLNMGASAVHSIHQFGLLRSEIQLNEGDIVVFYDGVNDVQQRIVYENEVGPMFGDPKNESFFIKLIRYANYHSSIAKLLYDIMVDNVRPISSSLVDESISRYIETLRSSENYVTSQNARFFHFLQPTLFTKIYLNDYEKSLIKMGYPFVPNQSKAAFKVAYPIIEERLRSEDYSMSLTDSFDHLETSPYLDFCHVNHIGNEIIANQIWSAISLRLSSIN